MPQKRLPLKSIKWEDIGGESEITLDGGEFVAKCYTTFRILPQSRRLIGRLRCEAMIPFPDLHVSENDKSA